MKEEDAHLLGSITGPYHPNIERSREEYFARKKEEDQRMLEKKARENFNNEWVMEKEKELRDLQKKRGCGDRRRCEACTPLHVGSDCGSAQVEFMKDEVHGPAKLVLLERRKKAVEMQWVSSSQAQHINSIWCPLSYTCEEMMDDDEEELFMTLSTMPKRTATHTLGNESLSNDKVSRQVPEFPREEQ